MPVTGVPENYDAKVTWAYLTYEITNELSVKLGRSRVPYFIYSDFLDVGYAYHWLRPPEAVYSLGFENQDGITLEHVTDMMGWSSRLTLMAGRSDSSVTNDSGTTTDIGIRNQLGGAWSMNRDWFTARIAYFESRLLIPFSATQQVGMDTLAAGIEAFYSGAMGFGVPGYSADKLDGFMTRFEDDTQFNEDRASFGGIGFAVDYKSLLAAAEYTMIRADDTPLEDRDAWYITAGYRIQKFTPFITYEKWNFNAQTDTVTAFENAAPATGIAPLDAGRADLIAGLEQVFSGTKDAETIGVGIRYDFHPSAAIKVEYNQQDNVTDDTKPKVLAAAVQLVF